MSLRERLASGGFAVTAEISPPRGADTGPITEKAALLRDWVDAVNVTDNQGSNVRLASWAGSLAAMAAGLEPVMQMTCRDRNRIALQSDLLGASALGIRNVLVMTGDHPKFGDHPEAKPVFDLDSVQLLWTLRHMRDQGVVLSGRPLNPPPDCFLGAVENPFAPPAAFRAERLGKKVEAGAQFVQTQFVFDAHAFGRWMAQVRDLGLHERCYILAGVGAVRSRRALDFMRDKVPGVQVPDDVYRRLRGVPADQTAAEGARLAAETIQQLSTIDGVAGVHLLVAGNEQAVPGILDERRRPGGPRWTLTCARLRSCGNPPRPGRCSARSWRRSAPRPPTWPGSAWSATGSSTSRTSARPWSAGRSRIRTSRSPSTCAAAAILT